MHEIEAIINTKYIQSLSDADRETLFQSFRVWSMQQQNEFVEGILNMEEIYEASVANKTDVLEQAAQGLQKTLTGLKRAEAESFHQEESEEKQEESQKAEAALSQL